MGAVCAPCAFDARCANLWRAVVWHFHACRRNTERNCYTHSLRHHDHLDDRNNLHDSASVDRQEQRTWQSNGQAAEDLDVRLPIDVHVLGH
ncbi:unannotated protein [freshwater metagenome]|uniref:Unannotated protein n=1 Tax=freshwater metagenome TaxID=449393 RepID=A0A6J6J0U6_9ZZZZ